MDRLLTIEKIMSIYSQQELLLPSSKQKSKYTNKSPKRKKHDSDIKLKRPKSNNKSVTKQIRAIVQKEFEQKYTEKEKLLEETQYKLELKQKWKNENMKALNHKPLNRADKDLFLQLQLITRDKIFHKIKLVTNQK